MARKSKPETPLKETVDKVVEKVKQGRKKTTTTKAGKKNGAKPAKAKQDAAKPATKPDETASSKKQEKQDAPAVVKRDKKGRFVAGGASGNPNGRPKGATSALITMARNGAAEIWPLVMEKARNGDKWAQGLVMDCGMPRVKPGTDPEMMNEKGQELMLNYMQGKTSLKDTALLMDMHGIPLPDSIRIMLGKEEPEPDDPTNGQYCTLTDEEMEERARQREAEIQAQREGLPERRAKINELYKGMEGKEAFAPNAKPIAQGE